MKSLEKFQYDSSPHTNEEVEELDESIVGMVRAGGEAVRNVLKTNIQKGKDLAKKVVSSVKKTPSAAPVAKRRNVRSQEFRTGGKFDKEKYDAAGPNRQKDPVERKRDNLAKTINNQSKKVERVQQRTDKKVATAAKNLTKSVEDTRKQVAGQKFAKKRIDVQNDRDNKPSLMNRVKRFGYKDPNKAKKLIDGGISSKLARNVGSVAKAVGQGITKTPSTKVSYNQKGDGYSGAFGGLGDNVKEVGKNVLKAPTYSSTTKNKKTGEVTKGAQVGTVGDKLGLTSLRNRNIDKPKSKEKVTGIRDDEADRKKITGGEPQSNVTQNNTKSKVQQLTVPGLTDKNLNPTTTDDEGAFRRKAQRTSSSGPMTSQDSPTGAVDKDGNPISRGSDEQAFITINDKKKKKPKITGDVKNKDGFPTGKDATHWLDAQKQHSSKTPKLFEQFLFEIDTRSTKKKKKDGRGMHPHDEIKPMSGTNTITINPEDETSKYKRGY